MDEGYIQFLRDEYIIKKNVKETILRHQSYVVPLPIWNFFILFHWYIEWTISSKFRRVFNIFILYGEQSIVIIGGRI